MGTGVCQRVISTDSTALSAKFVSRALLTSMAQPLKCFFGVLENFVHAFPQSATPGMSGKVAPHHSSHS